MAWFARLWADSRAPTPAGAPAPRLLFDEAFQRQLESLALASRRLASGRERAERRTGRSSSGVEFAEHRPYADGDDFRFVDWKVFARSDRMLLRQFEEEADLSVHVLLDSSASMAAGSGHKLVFAKQLAAALGYIALSNLDRVGVQTFANGLGARLPPMRGRNRVMRMLRFLEQVEPGGVTDFARAARSFAARERQRGIALVLSDGYDFAGLTQGIDALRYGRLEPVLLLLVDPAEESPPIAGEWLLSDSETGEERLVSVTPAVIARFRAARRAHFERLLAHCREKRVHAFELSVDQPFEQAVLGLLKRGGLLI